MSRHCSPHTRRETWLPSLKLPPVTSPRVRETRANARRIDSRARRWSRASPRAVAPAHPLRSHLGCLLSQARRSSRPSARSATSPRPAAATSRYVRRDASGNSPHADRRSPPPRDRPPIPRREKPPRRIARQRGFSRWRARCARVRARVHNGFSTVSRRRSRFFCPVQSRGALTASLPKRATEMRRAPTSAVCSAASPARRRVSRTPPRTRTRA